VVPSPEGRGTVERRSGLVLQGLQACKIRKTCIVSDKAAITASIVMTRLLH